MVAISPLLRDFLCDIYNVDLPQPYQIHQTSIELRTGYFLGDGTYPSWSIFSKPTRTPQTRQKNHSTLKGKKRKDIEKCFGVLQYRWNVLRHEINCWFREDIISMSDVAIILYNMLVRMVGDGVI